MPAKQICGEPTTIGSFCNQEQGHYGSCRIVRAKITTKLVVPPEVIVKQLDEWGYGLKEVDKLINLLVLHRTGLMPTRTSRPQHDKVHFSR